MKLGKAIKVSTARKIYNTTTSSEAKFVIKAEYKEPY